MISGGKVITNAKQVQLQVKVKHELDLNVAQVQRALRKDLGLGYRRVRKIPIQGNSERCLVLRQQYALTMLPLLKSGKRIINVDETWINETNFSRKIWCRPDSPGTEPVRAVSPSLSMIAALDTDGRVYFSLSHATTE